ncbi:hypothetical protein RvY_16316 [Ramazzottius varieornatus]|uniref:Uncharacterized protein n=1 Tax=Ramazzottius varieornatus TaxID=947166 RepID=A0A1D1VY16_RAMVA|nr:hypothetical protein RvY_16316 [Ramazzottius varieornatus]
MAAKVGSFAVVCLFLSQYLLQLAGVNPLARQDGKYGQQTDRTICWNAVYGYKDEPATVPPTAATTELPSGSTN